MKIRIPLGVALVLAPLPVLAASPQAELTETFEIASGPGASSFGNAVAIHGSTALVGDPSYDLGGLSNSGGAFVFGPGPGGTWVQVAELLTGTTNAGDRFGSSVWIHGDTAVVGAPRRDLGAQKYTGAAYVFERDQGGPDAWGLRAALLASDVNDPKFGRGFGGAVAVWGDWIVVGANPLLASSTLGAAYVFRRDQGGAGAWGETQKLTASVATWELGRSVALEGSTLVVGSGSDSVSPSGAAFVFERDGSGVWSEAQKLVSADGGAADFGSAAGLCGDIIVVGAPRTDSLLGAAYVFERGLAGPGLFGELQKLPSVEAKPSNEFGETLGLFGDRLVVGAWLGETEALQTGAAHYYELQDGAFAWAGRLRGSDASFLDYYGWGVAVGDDVALIGSLNGSGGPTVHYIHTVGGVALDPLANTLYGSDYHSGQLIRIDPTTGAGAFVGPLDHMPDGLAFDPGSGTLFGVNETEGLFTIDTASGAGALVGDLGGRDVNALAFDQSSGWLYGITRGFSPYELLRIDPQDASLTVIGSTVRDIEGLAFDAETGGLYAIQDDFPNDRLYAVDPVTAAVTQVGPLSASSSRFLADRSGAGLIHNGTDIAYVLNELQTADATTAAIGAWGAVNNSADPGSVYVFTLPSVDVAYCTAGTSASGCQAQLSASGVASASADSGFTLTAAEVEGVKDGLFFFGTGGRQANAWGNGTSYQCVVPPVARAGLLTGVGVNGQCDGAFAQDLNALWCPTCPKSAKSPGAGATVQAQLWYRDPQTTSNQTTSLSNAIEFTVAP